jgi:hypothetical protein
MTLQTSLRDTARAALLRTALTVPALMPFSVILAGTNTGTSSAHVRFATADQAVFGDLLPGDLAGTSTAPTVISLPERLLAEHSGTGTVHVLDLRSLMDATTLDPVVVEGNVLQWGPTTRMARIRAIAPLSWREWGDAFGVSHTTARKWSSHEPGDGKLDQVLAILEDAAPLHSDVAAWLREPVPGMTIRPLDAIANGQWLALRGALRSAASRPVKVTPDELVAQRRAEESWLVAEPDAVTEEA